MGVTPGRAFIRDLLVKEAAREWSEGNDDDDHRRPAARTPPGR
jgi:hypothetical protein